MDNSTPVSHETGVVRFTLSTPLTTTPDESGGAEGTVFRDHHRQVSKSRMLE